MFFSKKLLAESPLQKTGFARHEYLYTFLIAFGVAFLMFLPALIMGNGLFTFYGDYLVQQIPFYKHCHEMVRSGSLLWDWGTDLGSNFIGSYSFYLIGSPFFWITLPFPNDWPPYLMAPLFFLKFGVAALTSYMYIRKFTAKKETALVGALLYAFSGFQIYNIFFNHFHDVVALFPLILVGLEELITENRKGVFALAVGLSACCNYFFFVGEVVFVLLYFFLRLSGCHGWKVNLKKFGQLALEAVVGTGLAAVILAPSFLVVMSNPRVGGSLSGFSMLFYSNPQRYAAIVQSFLFPAELPSRVNFFPEANNKWTSMAGWLPMFGMTGVFAYLSAKRKTWLKRLIIISFVMMFVPVLNSTFVALNGSFYCRWYFMPILMMALASALALEDEKIDYIRGIRISAIATGVIVFAIGLIPRTGEFSEVGEEFTGFAALVEQVRLLFEKDLGFHEDAGRFWLYSLIALISLAMVYVLIRYFRKNKRFYQIAVSCLCFVVLLSGISFIVLGRSISGNHQWVKEGLVDSRLELPENPDESFFRVDFPDSFDNVGIYWDYPSVTTFHSVVPASIMEFYPVTGTPRDVGSRPELDRYGIRGMTSCKYYFQRGTHYDENDPPLPGFEYRFTSNDVTVWENTYFIPMGFTYDYAISRDELESYAEDDRDKVMLHALCLSDDDLVKYADILPAVNDFDYIFADEEAYFSYCTERQKNACDSFVHDTTGFTATITTQTDELVFFSVPYEEGWSATVNGKPAEIIISNIGFMSVVVEGGKESVIRFDYYTPGLDLGILLSVLSFIAFVAYLLIAFFLEKKRPAKEVADCCATSRCASCHRCFAVDRYTYPVKKSAAKTPFEGIDTEEDEIPTSLDGNLPPCLEEKGEATEAATEEEQAEEAHALSDESEKIAQSEAEKQAVDWLESLYLNPPDNLTDEFLASLAEDERES